MDDSDKKSTDKVAILRILATSFKDPAHFYPLALFTLLSTFVGALVFRMESLSPLQFIFFVLTLAVIFLVAPAIIRWNISAGGIAEVRQGDVPNEFLSKNVQLVGKEHPDIWVGFEQIYDAFNAPWMLEMYGDTESFAAIHRKRYNTKLLKKCRYLYYYANDDKNWTTFLHRFKFFIQFESMVMFGFSNEQVRSNDFVTLLAEKIHSDSSTANLNKLELYLAKGDIPQLTYFHGSKRNSPVSIMYFNVGPFMVRGMPSKVLYSEESEFSSRLGEHFSVEITDPSVKSYKGVEIFNLFIEMEQGSGFTGFDH